ncbi:Hypothetical protein POVR2_LOCUS117 [uncultured virus]|nr:Hypothetical protein POVR2_LOCUS117 [uncultured virus]
MYAVLVASSASYKLRARKPMESPFAILTGEMKSDCLSALLSKLFDKDVVVNEFELADLPALETVHKIALPVEVVQLAHYITCDVETDNSCSDLIEVYSDRPFFTYEVDETVSVSYGAFSNTRHLEAGAKKVRTYISIVDIYERYGLETACAFIQAVYTAVRSKTYRGTSMLLYVLGSLAVLDSKAADIYLKHSNEQGVSAILFEATDCLVELLIELENSQPKLAKKLETVTHELPTELLSIIFNSRRVDKATRALLLDSRRSRDIRQGELAARATLLPLFCVLDCVFVNHNSAMYVRSENVVILAGSPYLIKMEPREASSQGPTSIYSWLDYARILNRPAKEVFLLLTSRVNLTDLRQVCTLILMMQSRKVLESSADRTSWNTNADTKQPEEVSREQLVEMYNKLRDTVLAELEGVEPSLMIC